MPLALPKVIFGSSALGNLYQIVPDDTKRAIAQNWFRYQTDVVVDSAGKYGAGLALESIARILRELGIPPSQVRISNKLGWKRVPLLAPEPTFEKGAWFGLMHDAEQRISYDGILECYHQGNELLGEYNANLLSVHDPDEYLAAAQNPTDAARRYDDIRGAYQALAEIRNRGEATGIGVGSKDWSIIKRLFDDGVALDWVMLANSFTLYRHPPAVREFIEQLQASGVTIVNSAVFNAGFLIGGPYFDYERVTPAARPELFAWRDAFLDTCKTFSVSPAHACCQFAISHPGIAALALNTSNPSHVERNVSMAETSLPPAFWSALRERNLLSADYPFV